MAPWWVNFSSLKDDVDVDEHRQSFFCHRVLQLSICAVSQLECWFRANTYKHGPAPHMSGGTLACYHTVTMLAVPL